MRIFLVLLALSISLFAEHKGYVGFSIEDSSEYFAINGKEQFASAPQFKIKGGYGDIGGFSVEASFSYMDYATNIFSENDGAALMLDITVYKGWDVGYDLYPYLGLGIGMGDMKVDRELESSLTFSSFNFGGGIRYVISNTYDFDLGVNYKLRTWQTISLVADKINVTSHLINPYIGINYHF